MKNGAKSQTWLQGTTLLDLSSLLPGPSAAHLMAKYGARVIKVESPGRPDPARQFGYIPPSEETSSCYRAINSNKELVWLDLKSNDGRDKLYQLVKTADAAIEGYRPDVRRRLGIEYETLAALNPRLVYCSISGYDPNGPWRDRAGHDINFLARSGVLDQIRDTENHCVLPGLPLGNYVVAQAAAFRMTSAILGARSTGRGCHVEISIAEALTEIQAPFHGEAVESGIWPEAGQTLVTGKHPCYRLYSAGKRTFAVGALEPKFWEKFCSVIGRPDLVSRQFASGAESLAAVSEIERELAKKDESEWLRVFEEADCCVEPVLSVEEVLHGL